jgi:hypothetical protein
MVLEFHIIFQAACSADVKRMQTNTKNSGFRCSNFCVSFIHYRDKFSILLLSNLFSAKKYLEE